jgi:DNA polymerase-3 subunit delta'
MHHGWLLTGEHGIGKATLAFRLARYVLANPDPTDQAVQIAEDLSLDPAHPVSRAVSLGTHSDLLHLQREWVVKDKRYKTELSVDTVRRIIPFLGTTAGEGGWRIVIADPADEMSGSALNALLKNLEEPPRRTLFLLLSASRGSLPPTIRSRVRTLHLNTLTDEDVEAVLGLLGVDPITGPDRSIALALAGGRPRKLIEIARGQGVAQYKLLLRAIEKNDPEAQLRLSDVGREDYDQLLDLLLGYLHRRVHDRPEPDPAAAPARVPLVRWAELWEKATASGLEVDRYNLDRRQFLLEMLEAVGAVRRPGLSARR